MKTEEMIVVNCITLVKKNLSTKKLKNTNSPMNIVATTNVFTS